MLWEAGGGGGSVIKRNRDYHDTRRAMDETVQ